ncbi:unnamed protein product [Darwinula stevensoni]|uniref:RsmI HTH domain-containing protein n=1 Tax=Darwinula stevensoni TaxID=69355 RepID=A0A7R9AJV5_9CRUS|nr:unnamed protein product [Darwinula stevensoni]CAG0910336.1 unnamed protein product [Darwinula stevensoni]
MQAIAQDPRCAIVLEAPHRIAALFAVLGNLGERVVTIGREISKQFEEIASMPASQAAAWLVEKPKRSQGEFALLIHPLPSTQSSNEAETSRILALLLDELPVKTAAKLTAEITGQARNPLYELALRIKGDLPTP